MIFIQNQMSLIDEGLWMKMINFARTQQIPFI